MYFTVIFKRFDDVVEENCLIIEKEVIVVVVVKGMYVCLGTCLVRIFSLKSAQNID